MCANTFIITVLVLILSGCGSHPPGEVLPMHTVSEFSDDENASRWRSMEGFNRSLYKFNYEADRFVLRSVSGTKRVPRVARTGALQPGRSPTSTASCKPKERVLRPRRFLTNPPSASAGFSIRRPPWLAGREDDRTQKPGWFRAVSGSACSRAEHGPECGWTCGRRWGPLGDHERYRSVWRDWSPHRNRGGDYRPGNGGSTLQGKFPLLR
jgi:hypothetical protein